MAQIYSNGNAFSAVAQRLTMQRSVLLSEWRISSSFEQRRAFGAGDLKIVAARMKSVKSIQKITKAMKMVAASKLRMDQRRLENGIPFTAPLQNVVNRVKVPAEAENTPLSIIALSSDKGLCGGVNSFVARQCRQLLTTAEASGATVRIYGIGDKIRSAMQRIHGNRFASMFSETYKYPWNFTTASAITNAILADSPQRLCIVFNHFRSAVAYDTLVQNILTRAQSDRIQKDELAVFEFEPDMASVWGDLEEFYTACTIYGCTLDNIASEQSARMSAMDNASTNAGEMISALTLKYNRARQAKITTELVEIISGANALE